MRERVRRLAALPPIIRPSLRNGFAVIAGGAGPCARLEGWRPHGSRRRFAPPHHEESRYSIGKPRGLGPRGNAVSSAAISSSLSISSAAAALSAAWSGLEAFGIANTQVWRVRKLKATWRGDAPCAAAIVCSISPALLRGDGKSS